MFGGDVPLPADTELLALARDIIDVSYTVHLHTHTCQHYFNKTGPRSSCAI